MTFNFDEWAALYRRDPEAFEKRRAEEIARLLQGAPETNRQRLEGMQCRIDLERRRAKTPLGACIRLSNLMWESFNELQTAVDTLLHGLRTGEFPLARETTSAEVLSLEAHRAPLT
jgi:hypothetical protein